jgi:hypothetical protein
MNHPAATTCRDPGQGRRSLPGPAEFAAAAGQAAAGKSATAASAHTAGKIISVVTAAATGQAAATLAVVSGALSRPALLSSR